jgi:3-dehydrosphinganine reductase
MVPFLVNCIPILLAVLLVGSIVLDKFKKYKKRKVRLDGEHVVITGGSSGLGKEIAFLAAKRGAHVTILARDVSKLEDACKEIRAHTTTSDQKINYFQTDVTNYERTNEAIQHCEAEIGPIDILIASAGYSYPSKLEDIPLNHMKGMMDINYMGTVHAIKCVLASMKSRRKGKITVISSVGGLVGLYGFTGYSASKFALRGFAEALQMEVKPFNISVTIAFPPDMDTESLAEENKIKPLETKLISEAGGLLQPSKVGLSVFEDTLSGQFFSTTGLDAFITSTICVGMSPMSSVFSCIVQVLFLGPMRLIGLGYIYYFNGIVQKCALKKERQKKAE